MISLIEKAAEFHRVLEECIEALFRFLQPGPDVVSLYVTEGPQEPVTLAANVGLELGGKTISLKRGEGLTGTLITSPHLPLATELTHWANKAIDDIGEQRFPAYFGVALPPTEGARGALVLQRKLTFPPQQAFHITSEIVPPLFDWFLSGEHLLAGVQAFQPRLVQLYERLHKP